MNNKQQKEQFKQWLSQTKNYKDSTINSYIRALLEYDPSRYRFIEGSEFSNNPILAKIPLFSLNDGNIIKQMYDAIPSTEYEIKSKEDWRDDHGNLRAALAAYSTYLMEPTSADASTSESNPPIASFNTIWYGAPGTGKSYALNKELEECFSGRYERVTFYADYLHSQFVGSYKPITVPGKDEKGNDIRRIEYQFRPGPFTRVLIRALNDPTNNYALVIEELNRAEAASVFGDVFQLLDRRKDGRSEYAITVSEDLREYLLQEDITKQPAEDGEKKSSNAPQLTKEGREKLTKLTEAGDCSQIVIPGNMYILATMNSADQGVFPLDTAFKRRWDFEYVGIDDGADAKKDNGEFVIRDRTWVENRKTINENLLDNEVAEDKQMGPFFLGDPELEMKTEIGDHHNDPFDKAMKNKVIMYLFDDAAKYHPEIVFDTDTIFPDKDNKNTKKLSLQKLFDAWDKYDYGIFQGLNSHRTATNSTEQQPDETSSDNSAPADDMTGDTDGTSTTDVSTADTSTADSATPQTEE